MYERYDSNHKERDVKLPIYRQAIKKAIEQDLVQDEDIIAVFYGGLLGIATPTIFRILIFES
ncbi:MAG TPA: hypothetical protein K8V56_02965 [Sporosarcina psychrophila]|uniref:Uncharacterized protein n=1 Tax=Sporosarcina psychrophila TaxID=1476 RepID=A0A921FXA5_SPOPS|nr:hypothetical protein [Sporosarcina psychrophila]